MTPEWAGILIRECRKALQRNLDRLDWWATSSLVTLVKAKYWVLHLSHNLWRRMARNLPGRKWPGVTDQQPDEHEQAVVNMNMSNQVARRASGIQPVSKVVWPVGLGKWLFTCVQHQHLCLHYCVQLWALLYRKEVELLERVLRGAMKVVKELRNRVYKSSRENWGCLI